MATDAAPLIDLAAFEQGDIALRAKIAQLTDQACQHTGFIAVTEHGVDQNVINTMWNTMQEFFDMPASAKQKFNVPFPGYPYGYMGNEAETLAASLGNVTPPDLKETFNGGPINIPKKHHRSRCTCLLLCKNSMANTARRIHFSME